MPISPLAPGAFRSTNSARLLTETRTSLDDLQRQLATGKRSESFGGLGALRFTSLDFRAKASEVEGFRATISQFNIRVRQLDLGLTRLSRISDDVRSSSLLPQFDPDATGKTSIQKYIRPQFDEAIDILNTEVNGVRLYSGRTSDVRPVLDSGTILEGDAAGRAGVRQFIAERKAADFGTAPNEGRVIEGGGGATATLTEDGVHPFGFKLTAASSTTPTITAALTAGPPANIAFNVAANPADGDKVRFELTLPDGTKQSVELTARTGPLTPAGNAGEFEIGASPAATGANLRLSVAAAVGRASVTSLPAASAKAAANAFFAGSINNPPLRVSGPPATATALVAGTAANSVIWYQGDDQSLSARATASAKIDTTISVGVGVQANEEGIRRVLANLAVFVSESFANTPDDKGRYEAVSERLRSDLGQSSGIQRVQSILVEIAAAGSTLKQAEERHRTKLNFVETVIADVENSNQEETAAKLLSLQTKLQAAYQATAIISRLNLTDYLR
jgi:flagellar hook-associated protein 3 FlgL